MPLKIDVYRRVQQVSFWKMTLNELKFYLRNFLELNCNQLNKMVSMIKINDKKKLLKCNSKPTLEIGGVR